ncbi:MAG: phenylalanine--tRNA ligase subunit beta [Aeromonadaceae bacterium]|nr:phenylalanine--tRNA ligase subunit beta [Aeromonadaceae bacterium]MBP8773213.1 phenylalanine--tRNA ligase subunit beta [Aeromonadaceae bacterium]
MKFSKSWVDEWIQASLGTNELADQITMAGLEVDSVDAVAGEFSNVVVGEVVACEQHPDADKLRVTKVNVGEAELLDIVCGAPNCRQGLRVAVAKVGAVLPGNFEIKKAKLRGQPSHGMLCSYSELGIPVEADGIIELPLDAPVGTDLRSYLQLDDAMIEVDLTPNRADCLSIAGLAREIGVLNRCDVRSPEWAPVSATIDASFPITVTAAEACPRYLGRVIKGLNVKAETPLWMQEKLRRCGMRSIDPIVDVTNYVLLELGQPMHAFDLAKLESGLQVRMAVAGETLTLLDENEVSLNADTLVIADGTGPLAIAGIFGGLHSGVSAETQDILLECAFFSPLSIKGRARSYGLSTDSSHRFERGVDSQLQQQAMDRACRLLLDICGGEAGPVIEVVSDAHLPKPELITLRREKLNRVVGIAFDDAVVTDILNRLGLQVTLTAEGWQATSPSWRFDLAIEEDLIEEVARIYGYNNIPNLPPMAHLVMNEQLEADLPLKRARHLLVDRGFQEAITYSFVEPKAMSLLFPHQEPIILPFPISADMSAMRVSLWPGLINAVVYNQNRQQGRVRLFESGLRFLKDEQAENGIRQEPLLAGIISGNLADEHWSIPSRATDFFDLKGDVEALLELTGEAHRFSFVRAEHTALHPGQSAQVLRDGHPIGWIGVIHPSLEKKLGLKSKVVLFELELNALLKVRIPVAGEISRFPANRRDLALVVDSAVTAADILHTAKKIGGNQIVGINLFDIYQGPGVPEGKKSLAISLVLQDTQRTLEDKEIADTIANVVEGLRTEFNASLRD